MRTLASSPPTVGDVVDREKQALAGGRDLREEPARQIELLGLDEGTADRRGPAAFKNV